MGISEFKKGYQPRTTCTIVKDKKGDLVTGMGLMMLDRQK